MPFRADRLKGRQGAKASNALCGLKERPCHRDVVASSPQYGGNTDFFSVFSGGRLCGCGILLSIPLESQEIRHQPFSMIRPRPCRHFTHNYIKLLKNIFLRLKNSQIVSIDYI